MHLVFQEVGGPGEEEAGPMEVEPKMNLRGKIKRDFSRFVSI